MKEPEPTITIVCQRVPVPGKPGSYTLAPQVQITQMPGGWETAYDLLHEASKIVLRKMLKDAQGRHQGLIEVAQEMPR